MAGTRKRSARARDPHPEQALAELSAALESGLPPSVLLRGEERFFRDAGARAVLKAAAGRGDEICRHDAQDPEFSMRTLLDDLVAGALFAEARTIYLDNADKLLKKGTRGYSLGLCDALVARVKSVADGRAQGSLVLSASSLRADHVLVKAALAAGGVSVPCRRLYDSAPPWDPDPRKAELVQWLLARARQSDVPMNADEAVYVVSATGNDLSALLDKLAQLDGRGAEGLRELVTWDSGGTPWELAERMLEGDARRAVPGVEALFSAGFQGRDGRRTAEAPALVNGLASALSSKLRETVCGAEAAESGLDAAEAAAAAGVKGGARGAQALQARLGMRSADQWRSLLRDTVELERRSRSGARVDVNDFARLALRWARRVQG